MQKQAENFKIQNGTFTMANIFSKHCFDLAEIYSIFVFGSLVSNINLNIQNGGFDIISIKIYSIYVFRITDFENKFKQSELKLTN